MNGPGNRKICAEPFLADADFRWRSIEEMRLWIALMIASFFLALSGGHPAQAQTGDYLGFDRNDYPGDVNLAALHQTFAFSGYWLTIRPARSRIPGRESTRSLRRRGSGFWFFLTDGFTKTCCITRRCWVSRTAKLRSRPPGTKVFRRTPSFFWTSNKVVACCLNRRHISTRGWTQ